VVNRRIAAALFAVKTHLHLAEVLAAGDLDEVAGFLDRAANVLAWNSLPDEKGRFDRLSQQRRQVRVGS
jgi:hypothetical protein